MGYSPRKKHVHLLLLASLMLLLCDFTATAQGVDQSMDIARPVPGVGHDYVKGLNETVNPANGSVSIKIDLPTPASRGLSLPFSLIYNSGIVHHTVIETFNGGQNVGLVMDGIYYKPTDRSINGWSDTIPYAAASSWSINSPPPANQQGYCDVTASYTLYDEAGGSHPLGITAISGIIGGNGGGTDIQSNPCTAPNTYSSNPSWAANGIFAKIIGGPCDGLNNTSACAGAAPAFTATNADSTVYKFPSGYVSVGRNASGLNPIIFPTTIEDRNGNVVQVTSDHSSTGFIPIATSVADTAGRQTVSVAYQGGTNIPSAYTVGGLTYDLGYITTSASYTSPSSQIAPLPPNGNITCNANFAVSDTGMTAIHTISLPNNKEYTIDYDPVYGLVSEIHYPNGGWVKYTWKLNDTLSDFVTIPGSTTGPPAFGFCNFEYKTPAIATRTVGYTASGGAAQTQTFTYSTVWNNSVNPAQWTSKITTVTTTDNISGKTSKTIYEYKSSTVPTFQYAQNINPPQIAVEKTVTTYDWGPTAAFILKVNKDWSDPYAMISETDTLPSGKSHQTTHVFDFLDRVTETKEFDFSQNLYRRTEYSYYGISPSVASPCQEVVYDGSSPGNRIAETDVYYDGGTTTCASGKGTTASVTSLAVFPDLTPTHDEANYGPAVAVFRGNVTKLVRWSNNGPSPTVTFAYDETGQRVSMTDACGNTACSDVTGTGHTTTYSYTDVPGGGNPAGNSNAYLTKLTHPVVNGVTSHEDFSYYYDLGSLASSSDVNGNTTNYAYYGDSNLNRLQQVQGPLDPNNGNARPTTTYSYDDSVPSATTTITTGTGSPKSATASMDGLGHVIKTDRADSNAYGDDIVLSTYDGMGHLASVTNPSRSSSDPSLPQGAPTKYAYDALGRMTIQTNQDASTKQWCRDGFTSSGQTTCPLNLSSITNSTWTDFYDETTRHWQRVTDAEGRLVAVMEPEASTTPSLETDYKYDLLDNLVRVDQWGGATGSSGDRIRTFVYDSLSRLTNACNPESIASGLGCTTPLSGTFGSGTPGSWSDIYTYDANGNVSTKVDARAITTSYSYDVLNRPLLKSYSDTTPAVHYQYDLAASGWGWGTAPNPQVNMVGRLAGVSVSAAGQNAWIVYGYDSMGRVTMKSECLPRDCGSNHHDMRYGYDLAGDMTFYDRGTDLVRNTSFPNQGYYFGGFNMAYDTAGNIKSVTADTTDANHPSTILGSATYTPLGGLFQANMVGVYLQTRTYNNRGWYTGIGVINSAGQAIWSTSTGYFKNASVSSSTDTWNGSWSYLYGNTNRLAQVIGSSLTLAYTYDHWGNRTSQLITTGSGTAPQWTDQQYNANNHLTTTWIHDAAGNVTYDGFHHYTYDAENRVSSVDTTVATYAYDGENNRVAYWKSGAFQREYLYDFRGRLMTEIGLDFKAARANIYVGNELFAEDAPDPYRTSTSAATLLRIGDQLGTLRARWDIGSNWVGACSSLPYGDAMTCTSGGGFGLPINDMLFTGKQRDQESDLDYFGARYYNSTRGRFMTPDWAAKPEAVPYSDLTNPQSLNLYGYVNNNPLSRVDSDGHCCDLDDAGNFVAGFANAFGSDNLAGAGRMNQTTEAGRVGAAFGDFGAAVVGGIQVVVGTGGNIAGVGLDATGVGAAIGVSVNVVSTAVTVEGASAATTAVVAMGIGSYTNTHESGRTYSGKGDQARSQASGKRVEKRTGDKHVATDHKSSPNDRESFKDESRRIDANGGVGSDSNYNKIESPGRNYRRQDGSQ